MNCDLRTMTKPNFYPSVQTVPALTSLPQRVSCQPHGFRICYYITKYYTPPDQICAID